MKRLQPSKPVVSRTMAEIGLNGAKNQAILKAAQAYIGLKKLMRNSRSLEIRKRS